MTSPSSKNVADRKPKRNIRIDWQTKIDTAVTLTLRQCNVWTIVLTEWWCHGSVETLSNFGCRVIVISFWNRAKNLSKTDRFWTRRNYWISVLDLIHTYFKLCCKSIHNLWAVSKHAWMWMWLNLSQAREKRWQNGKLIISNFWAWIKSLQPFRWAHPCANPFSTD